MSDLPANVEVERAVLSRLLMEPEQVPLVAQSIERTDFSSPVHRQVWDGMTSLINDGKTIDIQTLADAVGMSTSALSRVVSVPSGQFLAPIEEYVELVQRDAFRRKVITELQNVIDLTYSADDPNDLIAKIGLAVERIGFEAGSAGLIDPASAAASYEGELLARRAGKSPGLTYGIGDLDMLLQPAKPGDMIVVAARPSIGKTAFAENVAESWARQTSSPILFASLEMSLHRLLDRAIARQSGLDSDALVRGALTASQYDLALATAEDIQNVNIWYLDDPSATTGSIRAAAARMKMLTGNPVGAIIIDYLQLLRDAGDQEVQRVTRISRAIKALALEFSCPVLVLSQLNRAVESREDIRPRLHDLRESGAIEQDSDVVIAISRVSDEATFSILKQRHGIRGTEANLMFDGAHMRWMNGWRSEI